MGPSRNTSQEHLTAEQMDPTTGDPANQELIHSSKTIPKSIQDLALTKPAHSFSKEDGAIMTQETGALPSPNPHRSCWGGKHGKVGRNQTASRRAAHTSAGWGTTSREAPPRDGYPAERLQFAALHTYCSLPRKQDGRGIDNHTSRSEILRAPTPEKSHVSLLAATPIPSGTGFIALIHTVTW